MPSMIFAIARARPERQGNASRRFQNFRLMVSHELRWGRVMHGNLQRQVAEAREIEGRLLSGRDKIVPPPLWVDFARVCWPSKTAAHIAGIGGRDERTAKRWLSGEFEPPNAVMSALIQKLFERRV